MQAFSLDVDVYIVDYSLIYLLYLPTLLNLKGKFIRVLLKEIWNIEKVESCEDNFSYKKIVS